MRTLTPALAAAALAAHGAPAPLPKPDPSKEDLKRMQGRWDIASAQHAASPPQPMPRWQVVVAGRRLKFVYRGRVITEWDCTLDPGKRPKHLTMKGVGESARFTLRALYSVEGNSLTFCYGIAGGKRPADLAKTSSSTSRGRWRRTPRRAGSSWRTT
jgi:uncharacterized protein (TIGR03067 family)